MRLGVEESVGQNNEIIATPSIFLRQAQLRLLVVGSGDLKGCNDVWGRRRIRGQLFQLKSRANLSTSEANPHGGNAMQCSYTLCASRYALWSRQTDSEEAHEGSPSIKRVLSFLCWKC